MNGVGEVREALELGRLLIHFGEGARVESLPLPSKEEAAAAIRQHLRVCGFTWMTGERALFYLTDGKEGWAS